MIFAQLGFISFRHRLEEGQASSWSRRLKFFMCCTRAKDTQSVRLQHSLKYTQMSVTVRASLSHTHTHTHSILSRRYSLSGCLLRGGQLVCWVFPGSGYRAEWHYRWVSAPPTETTGQESSHLGSGVLILSVTLLLFGWIFFTVLIIIKKGFLSLLQANNDVLAFLSGIPVTRNTKYLDLKNSVFEEYNIYVCLLVLMYDYYLWCSPSVYSLRWPCIRRCVTTCCLPWRRMAGPYIFYDNQRVESADSSALARTWKTLGRSAQLVGSEIRVNKRGFYNGIVTCHHVFGRLTSLLNLNQIKLKFKPSPNYQGCAPIYFHFLNY